MLCQDVINSRRKERKGMAIKINENGRPYLDLRLVTDDPLNITFELTPTRFEFLARAAAGALPSSFSSECLEDVLALKARLLRRVERLQQIRIGDDGDDDIDENSLSLGFLEIEMGGQGLAREILVRLPK